MVVIFRAGLEQLEEQVRRTEERIEEMVTSTGTVWQGCTVYRSMRFMFHEVYFYLIIEASREFRPLLLSGIKSAEQVPENIGQLLGTFSTGWPQNKPRRNL
jgi:hypothetical protein